MKRHALFVGVDNYADPTIQNLNYPSEDATELASVFRRLLKFDRVEKLINPTHSPEVVDAIKGMTTDLGSGDLFLFFFAGHGFRVKENHVLVCAKDEFADLEDEYAGLPVGQLKKRMRGPWNRMLILDACQNDIRATRGADTGATERDLALIHEAEGSSSESGCQIVLTACSEGQKALEVSDLGHGLFTSAFLDSVTFFADARRRLDLESLRADLGKRMSGLIAQYRLSGRQEPLFTMPTDASRIVLLDGATSVSVSHYTPTPPSVSSLVVCPVCGKTNEQKDTFKCRECGRNNLCLRHQNDETFLCVACSANNARKTTVPTEDHHCRTANGISVQGGSVSILGVNSVVKGGSVNISGCGSASISNFGNVSISIGGISASGGNVRVGGVSCKGGSAQVGGAISDTQIKKRNRSANGTINGSCTEDITVEAGRKLEIKGSCSGNVRICKKAILICHGSCSGNVDIEREGRFVCFGSMSGNITNHCGVVTIHGSFSGTRRDV